MSDEPLFPDLTHPALIQELRNAALKIVAKCRARGLNDAESRRLGIESALQAAEVVDWKDPVFQEAFRAQVEAVYDWALAQPGTTPPAPQ